MRTIPPWVGRTDDAKIPERVRIRILERQRDELGRPICPECGLPIRPGDGAEFDHEVPLIDGGKHAESNLRAIHRRPCHANKTAAESTQRAENRATVKSHYGLKEPSRGFATNRNGDWKKKNERTGGAAMTSDERLAKLEAVYAAARGLVFGTDWNQGTHARLHGYRNKLIDAVVAIEPDLELVVSRTRTLQSKQDPE